MYLLDTNILVEVLFAQARSDEVEAFLDWCPPRSLHLTDFSLGSIGIMLFRKKMHDSFMRLAEDLIIGGGIDVVQLPVVDLKAVVNTSILFKLDFDDAYQYATAEKYNLTLVSFDSDFDRTERRRKTPAEVVQG